MAMQKPKSSKLPNAATHKTIGGKARKEKGEGGSRDRDDKGSPKKRGTRSC